MVDDVINEVNAKIRSYTNEHVTEWKNSGRPVIGYFCHYMPAELILAAGALPLRLRGAGSEDSSAGDAFMSGRVCTYVRHVMSLAVEGDYDFLDGEICLNTCDHVRRAADLFVKKTNIPFHGFISLPRNPRESLYGNLLKELRNLRVALQDHFGVEITDDRLREAIIALNRNRRLLTEINNMRKEDKPKLSGAESLSVHIASQVLPPDVFAGIAERLIKELKDRPGLDSPRGRLVMLGAELDEPDYVAVIESQGALVVADLLCFGQRSVLDPIDENTDDPLDAIGRAYFFRPSCARMIGDFPARWDNLNRIVSDARADGVIFTRLLFCDPWGAEQHNLLHRAKKGNTFPVLTLTKEYGIVPTGQLRTRVQAFLEKIEIARAKRDAVGGAV